MTVEFASMTATEARGRLTADSLSAEQLVHICFDRIAAREPQVQAWSHLAADQALADARRLDALPAADRGPLHGLPIGIKDVFLTRDMPTQYGSPLYRDFAPEMDAAAVAILRAAGAILIGKTHTVEFAAIGAKPPTRNPANLEHTPGGSSSGSAAAVADGHVPLALGTQTGGSIIRPAAFCGAWGFKPSWGLVDRDGAKAFAPSLDTVGWFGGSADDLALLLGVYDPAPPETVPAALNVAFCRTPMWADADRAVHDAFTRTELALQYVGARVTHVDLPEMFADLPRDHATIMFGEGAASFQAAYHEHGDALDAAFRTMIRDAPGHGDLCRAYDRAAAARPMFDALARDFDAIIVPSVPGEAPAGLANSGSYIFNGLWSLLHTPCVNMPLFRGPSGLPVGLTATGPRFADAKVIAAAGAIATAVSAYSARN